MNQIRLLQVKYNSSLVGLNVESDDLYSDWLACLTNETLA